MKCIRQGDVLLMPAAIPQTAKRIKNRPVAYGEVTGHHHSLMSNVETPVEDLVEMYEGDDGKTYVRVLGEPGEVSLVHQQHKAQQVEPIEYVYVPQVENTDWGTRPVVD
jgi:hypothetical protein